MMGLKDLSVFVGFAIAFLAVDKKNSGSPLNRGFLLRFSSLTIKHIVALAC